MDKRIHLYYLHQMTEILLILCFCIMKYPYGQNAKHKILTSDNAGQIMYDVLRTNEQHLSLAMNVSQAIPAHITR